MKNIISLFTILLSFNSYAIIGGSSVPKNGIDYQIRINHLFSGTFIKHNFILTTAHAFYFPKGIRDTKLSKDKKITITSSKIGKSVTFKIKNFFIHPKYNSAIQKYKDQGIASSKSPDIAIIEVYPKKHLFSISSLSDSKIDLSKNVVITGAGCTKRASRLGLNNFQTKKFKYATVGPMDKFYKLGGNHRALVTPKKNAKLCDGDSGGAVYQNSKIVAINSFFAKKLKKYFNFHVLIDDARSWINQILR